MKTVNTITKIIGMLALFLSFQTYEAQAQQDARYSMYMFNGMLLNPAYTGSTETTSLAGFYRNQWVNIEGAPETFSFSAHTALGKRKQYGVGGWVEYDRIHIHDALRVFGTYAYKFDFGAAGKLALGVQGGIRYIASNWTQLSPPELETIGLDPVLLDDMNVLLPNFGVGAYFYGKRYYAGISIPHLLDNELWSSSSGEFTAFAKEFRHYFFTAGGALRLGDNADFLPSVLIKAVPKRAPIQTDVNASFLIKDMLIVGSSFRFANGFEPESANFMLGVMLKNGLRVAYAFDLTLSELNDFNSGSHEITIGYDIPRKGDRLKTPRYF